MSEWKVIAADFDATSRAVFTVTKGSKRLDHREQEELEALLAGWVSVDESLPPPRATKVSVPVFFINDAGHWAGFYMIDDRVFVSSDSWEPVPDVTHFMPRPELPTK